MESKKSFPNVSLYIKTLRERRDEIVDKWVHTPSVLKRLNGCKIDADIFASEYAKTVYEYFLGVVSGDTELGNCPVVMRMLEEFKNHHIPLDDLFVICVSLKNHLIFLLQDLAIRDRKVYAELMVIMDANFAGVMNRYIEINYNNLLDDAKRRGEKLEVDMENLEDS